MQLEFLVQTRDLRGSRQARETWQAVYLVLPQESTLVMLVKGSPYRARKTRLSLRLLSPDFNVTCSQMQFLRYASQVGRARLLFDTKSVSLQWMIVFER